MPDENNTQVETPVVDEPTVDNQAAPTPEGEAEVPQSEPQADIDFSDLPGIQPDPEPQPAATEPNPDAIVDKLMERLTQAKQAEAGAEDEGTYVTKEDLANLRQSVVEEIQKGNTEQQKAQQIIQQNIEASSQVETVYGKKLESFLESHQVNDQRTKDSAQLLYENLRMRKCLEVGRQILTPQETTQLVQQHYAVFKKTYLGEVSPSNPASLSPMSKGVAPENQAPPTKDELSELHAKSKEGKAQLSDYAKMLTRIKN